jgi:hypothetical protein
MRSTELTINRTTETNENKWRKDLTKEMNWTMMPKFLFYDGIMAKGGDAGKQFCAERG